MKILKKYVSAFAMSMASAMEYRSNFLLSLLSGVFVVIIQYYLWTAIYAGSGSEAMFGYEYSQMIVYIVMAALLSKVMSTGFEWEIASDIKDGGLSRFLVQPIRYFPYRMMLFFGQKIVQILLVSLLSFLILGIFGVTLGAVYLFDQIEYFLLAVLLALMLNSLLFYCFSSFAFWVTEVWAIFVGLGVASNILSGGIFPLDVFGTQWQQLFALLPFQYVIYFPLNILTGKYTPFEIMQGFLVQGIWIIALYSLSLPLWKAGMKKYIAAGG